MRVELQKNEQQNRKAQKRRTSIANKGQGNAYNREYTYRHPDIDHKMKEKYRGHRISIDS